MAILSNEELLRVRASAEVLYDRKQIAAAVDEIAAAIERDAGDKNPLLLCVMNGGLVLTGQLLSRLGFPLRLDYIHVSRYRNKIVGEDLQWIRTPDSGLEGQTVLIVDDILDEGYTLEALIKYCTEAGAKEILTAVMIEKERQRDTAVKADYVGLKAPDNYLFGFGMDYKGYWRNSDVIYSIPET